MVYKYRYISSQNSLLNLANFYPEIYIYRVVCLCYTYYFIYLFTILPQTYFKHLKQLNKEIWIMSGFSFKDK